MLNRVVRWTTEGWEVEPDQRHVDLIIKVLGLSEAKPVSTPGEPESRDEEEENSRAFSTEDASKFRALAARANYLAADRTDIMYAVRNLSPDGKPYSRSVEEVEATRAISQGQCEIGYEVPMAGGGHKYRGLQ